MSSQMIAGKPPARTSSRNPGWRSSRLPAGTWTPLLLTLALLVAGAVASFWLNGYYVFVLANVALLALCGIGLNVLLGLSGQISFGHVGFYAIGAYTTAILMTSLQWSFWIAWPLAAVAAGLMGGLLALPALRVKGPYLAMVTIAFGFIVEHSIVEMRDLTGGQNGIMGIFGPDLGEFARGEHAMALLAIAAVAVALIAFTWISTGSWGAAMRAVRDSETAAESTGFNPLAIKTVAFVVSAVCAGAAGAVFAPLSGFVTPHTFGFMQSILFVLVVMLGGAGSIAGPVLGAIIVGLLPEVLSGLEEFRLLFFGGLLLLVLWLAPNGLTGLWHGFMKKRYARQQTSPAGSIDPALDLPVRERSALSIDGLTMRFGGVTAVDNLSLHCPRGQITSLIGPNGAGKTTVLNMLSGFYQPVAGSFSLNSNALAGKKALQIARAGIARTYQTSQLFNSLSVETNVIMAMGRGSLGSLFGAGHLTDDAMRDRAHALLAACGYTGSIETLTSELPHVDRRLVEVARALAADPDVLLLDETAAGLSREDKTRIAALLRRIADAGVAILLVEHDMPLVMGISDQIMVLDAGEYLAHGPPASVQANPKVREAYLGDAHKLTRKPGARPDGTVEAAQTKTPDITLDVQALTAGYGAAPVLKQVSVKVHRQEAVALLGANGAGKSTLLRAIIGLHRPASGDIRLDGSSIAANSAEAITARGMVLVPEGRQVFPDLSVADNLRLGAFINPIAQARRIEEMLTRFPRLKERLHQPAGLLSGGEQQMLAIGRALMSRPHCLLLDEPSLGLAPRIIEELFTALDGLRSDGMTLLLVDQMATLALAVADRAYVMESGVIVAQGSADEIAADDALTRAYLGTTEDNGQDAAEYQALRQEPA